MTALLYRVRSHFNKCHKSHFSNVEKLRRHLHFIYWKKTRAIWNTLNYYEKRKQLTYFVIFLRENFFECPTLTYQIFLWWYCNSVASKNHKNITHKLFILQRIETITNHTMPDLTYVKGRMKNNRVISFGSGDPTSVVPRISEGGRLRLCPTIRSVKRLNEPIPTWIVQRNELFKTIPLSQSVCKLGRNSDRYSIAL